MTSWSDAGRGVLRSCPECGGTWPKGPDFDLRGCGWLQGLDRHISPSNGDVRIHDGAHGANRFLQMEIKTRGETWPPMAGQAYLLRALAAQPGWTVLYLRGNAVRADVHRVTRDGIADGIRTHTEAVRRAVNAWIGGSSWDAASRLLAGEPSSFTDASGHCHSWARVDGVWTCVRNHHSRPGDYSTGCGQTWEPSGASASA